MLFNFGKMVCLLQSNYIIAWFDQFTSLSTLQVEFDCECWLNSKGYACMQNYIRGLKMVITGRAGRLWELRRPA